jgi:hypothetical protein
MTPHRALACLVATATLGALLACSSGPGNKFISSTSSPHERSDETSDSPGSDQTDSPPEVREGAACLPCTGSYKCSGTIDDLAQQSQIFTLKRSDCASSDTQRNNDNVITFACGGTVAIPGRTVVGTWKDVGAGVLQICFGVLGRDQCLSCSPTVATKDDQTGGTRDAGRRD